MPCRAVVSRRWVAHPIRSIVSQLLPAAFDRYLAVRQLPDRSSHSLHSYFFANGLSRRGDLVFNSSLLLTMDNAARLRDEARSATIRASANCRLAGTERLKRGG